MRRLANVITELIYVLTNWFGLDHGIDLHYQITVNFYQRKLVEYHFILSTIVFRAFEPIKSEVDGFTVCEVCAGHSLENTK